MKTAAVINVIHPSEYSFKEIFDGKSSFKLAVEFSSLLPHLEKTFILTTGHSPLEITEDVQLVEKELWNEALLFSTLKEIAGEYDHIFYFFGDSPFLDKNLANRLFDQHNTSFAEYSFSDGYPHGFSVEILKKSILGELEKLSYNSKKPVTRSSIFQTVQININNFDLETDICSVDYRLLRLSLTTDNLRNFELTKALYNKGGRDFETVQPLLESNKELFRLQPSYYNIQITPNCPQDCMYCPFPSNGKGSGREYSLDQWKTVLEKICAFSDDAHVSLSFMGEPSSHTQIYEFLEMFSLFEGLVPVVETSGLGWDFDKLVNISRLKDILWIISMDASDPVLYKHLRGEGLDEVSRFAEKMLTISPEGTYIQSVRMDENEEHLEHFYRFWKEKTENVIIQKYNNFSGLLEQRKITDLSPLNRFPCWSIKREMTVDCDGNVLLCRNDIRKEHIFGNIFKETLPEIWERMAPFYLNQLEGKYTGICGACDEYYTFTF